MIRRDLIALRVDRGWLGRIRTRERLLRRHSQTSPDSAWHGLMCR